MYGIKAGGFLGFSNNSRGFWDAKNDSQGFLGC